MITIRLLTTYLRKNNTMSRKIQSILCLFLLAFTFTGCYEDKGNYTYGEKPEITATGFPQTLSVVQNAESIELKPSFTSSLEGHIDNNPNFEYGCVLWRNSGLMSNGSRQMDINEEHTKDVSFFTTVDEGDYTAWYTVRDKRTDVVTNFPIPIKVTSATYEGWMVLCDDMEGYASMDMIAILADGRNLLVRNIFGEKTPKLKNGKRIYLDPWPRYAKGDMIWYCTEEGSYSILANKLNIGYNVAENEIFSNKDNEQVVMMDGLYMSENFAVTDKGNLYVKLSYMANSMFEDPINTFTAEGDPEFKVAPFIGVSYNRPLGQGDYVALFYDQDNKRFLKWDEGSGTGICQILDDPANKLFSFQTGMDMIDMKNTKFSGGVVYSILQNASGQRYVYGINLSGGAFEQTIGKQIKSQGFNNAKQYAFHSQYPYMFYDNGDKVVAYQLMTDAVSEPLTLPGEEITLLKFNTFMRTADALYDNSESFLEQQYYLIVGSYKKNDSTGKGGMLRFYKFDQASGSLSLVKEYEGFGNIKDVTYRER